MNHIRHMFMKFVSLTLAGAVLFAPVGALQAEELSAPTPVAPTSGEDAPSGKVNLVRVALGFALTSGIKYALGGLGPAKLLPILATMNPALAAPALIAFSMAEAVASIAIFNKVAGIQKTDRQVMAFVLASAASALATPFLMSLGPVGATVAANAGRLILFNLIARRDGEKFSLGLSSMAGIRPDQEGTEDPEVAATASTEGMAPDFLWARSPATQGGSLIELHRKVQETYDRLVVERPQLSEDGFRKYASAKASLERALQEASAAAR